MIFDFQNQSIQTWYAQNKSSRKDLINLIHSKYFCFELFNGHAMYSLTLYMVAILYSNPPLCPPDLRIFDERLVSFYDWPIFVKSCQKGDTKPAEING